MTDVKIPKAEQELRDAIAKVPFSEGDKKAAAELIKQVLEDGTKGVSRLHAISQGVAAALWANHNNTRNRKLDPATCYRYRDAMAREEWKENSATIGIMPDGNLGDGQHRLGGVALSGVTVRFYFALLEAAARDTIDRSLGRTTAQALDMMGVSTPVIKARIVKSATPYILQVDQGTKPPRLTDQQIEKIVQADNDLLDKAISMAADIHQHTSQPISPEPETAMFAYVLLRGGYEELYLRTYLHDLQQGQADHEDSAGFAFYKALDKSKGGRNRDKLSVSKRLALLCKAIQIDVAGRRAGRLAFDPKKEGLPDYHRPKAEPEPTAQAA